MLVPVVPPAPQAAPSAPVARPQPPATALDRRLTVVASAAPVVDLRPQASQPQTALPAPAKLNISAPVAAPPDQLAPAAVETERAEMAEMAEAEHIDAATPSGPVHAGPLHAHGGWLIQIGAFDDEGDAKQHLNAAQLKAHAALAAKDPFTERVQKGDKSLYRARFAGFDKATAEAACRALKRSDFQCMALKD
jgi:D-alanyl-D-alanine carboxypeptidase